MCLLWLVSFTDDITVMRSLGVYVSILQSKYKTELKKSSPILVEELCRRQMEKEESESKQQRLMYPNS